MHSAPRLFLRCTRLLTMKTPLRTEVERDPLYANAIDMIEAAVEDYLAGNDRRYATAVRNLVSGLLLMSKEKLRRLSPTASGGILVYEKLRPVPDGAGGIKLERVGRTTATFNTIKERLNSMGIPPSEFKALETAVETRNQLEHHYLPSVSVPGGARANCRAAFSSGYEFLSNFMPNHLGDAPGETFSHDIWSTLLQENEIEVVARNACRASFASIDWASAPPDAADVIGEFECRECTSGLLAQDDPLGSNFFAMDVSCKVCGSHYASSELIEAALERHFSGDWHVAAMEGQDEPSIDCEICNNEGTYVVEQDVCYSCGHVRKYVDEAYEDHLRGSEDEFLSQVPDSHDPEQHLWPS
jgi:hypothetical protein